MNIKEKILIYFYSTLTLIIFLHYYYNFEYFFILQILAAVLFLLIIFLLIIKKIINLKIILKFIHKEYQFKIVSLIILFIVTAILILNILVISDSELSLNQILKNFPNIESNIIYQITTIFLFDFVFILILWSVGNRIIKLLKLSNLQNGEKFIFSFGLGAIPLIFSTLALAISGLLYTKFILLFLIIWVYFSIREILDNFKNIGNYVFTIPATISFFSINFFKKLVAIIIFISSIFLFISAIQPQPINYDSLHSYYNAPKLSLDQHNLVVFSYFPSGNISKNMEMLYINILSLADSRYLSHISLIYLLFTLLAIYYLSKRFFTPGAGLFAVLVYFFSPVMLLFVNSVKVDLALTFFSTLIIYSFFIWLYQPCLKWLIIMGGLLGLTMGIKYNAIFLLIAITAVLLILSLNSLIKQKKLGSYKNVFLVIIFAVIFFSPWLIRNKLLFNNYFYPFRINSTVTELISTESDSSAIRQAMLQRVTEYKDIIIQEGRGKLGYILNWFKGEYSKIQNFGPLLLTGIIWIFFPKKNINVKLLMSIFLIYFFLWLVRGNLQVWFCLPIFPILSILIALAIERTGLFFKSNLFKVTLISYFLICFILFSHGVFENYLYLSGFLSKDQYLDNWVIINKVENLVNNMINENEKVLVVFDMRIAFIKDNNKNTIFDHRLEQFFNPMISKTSDEVYNSLKKENIRYLIYNENMAVKLNEMPYKTSNNNLINHPSYISFQESINLINQFKRKYLALIDCSSSNGAGARLCLYKVN